MAKIWGHRGACGYAPENTLEAFALALEMGADGLELDTYVSADGQIVVTHDDSLLRCGGNEMNVRQNAYEDIAKVNVSHRFADKYPVTRVPLLKEVFELMKKYPETELNIEMKDVGERFIDTMAKVCIESGMLNRIVFSCFNGDTLIAMKNRLPEARYALLYSDRPDALEFAISNSLYAVHPYTNWALAEDNMKKAHEAGIKVNVWTVNDPEVMKQLMAIDADALITNLPDIALKTRDGE